ncbi:MAG: DNA primase [Nitrosomonas sp.]|nr:DNA primase [Nitrosomonas sp.]MDP1951257.1 DNA primase [Nitrosomonas sp.]
MIPPSFIHDLLNRVDIVNVVDRHVPLKKAGANYSACCPFHNEKSPSFTVSPTKQFFHCFGCGAHGSAINFLMEYSGMSFVDAVADLATSMGMQVPTQTIDLHSGDTVSGSRSTTRGQERAGKNKDESRQNLNEVMRAATQFYRAQLKNADHAVKYLKKRGLTGETAAHFAIGYAPAGWQNLEAVFPEYQMESSRNLLIKAGLIIETDDGKRYDRFRDRIIFPILGQKGMIVGFGGRVLEQGDPKYLNSPETPLFAKGHELYNLFSARRAIREAGRVLVVEGYMDVVALYQHGIKYSVAALGTATTSFHIQKLLRQTDDIIFCFDGDRAGKKAAWRAMENSLPYLTDGKNLSFLFLPEGEDPDSYIGKFGKETFEGLFKQALPLSAFLFKELLEHVDLQTSEGRTKLVHDAKPLLKQVTAPIMTLMLLKRLAELSGINQNELESLLQIKRVSSSRSRERAPRPQPVSPYYWLIQILLYQPAYINKLDRDLVAARGEFYEEIKVLKALIEFLDVHPHVANEALTSSVVTYFHDSPHRELLEKIETETLEWDSSINLEAEFSGALERLQEIQRKQRMTELHNKSLNMLTDEEKQELKKLAIS